MLISRRDETGFTSLLTGCQTRELIHFECFYRGSLRNTAVHLTAVNASFVLKALFRPFARSRKHTAREYPFLKWCVLCCFQSLQQQPRSQSERQLSGKSSLIVSLARESLKWNRLTVARRISWLFSKLLMVCVWSWRIISWKRVNHLVQIPSENFLNLK